MSDGIIIPGVRPFNNPLASPDSGAEFSAGKDDGSAALTIDSAGVVTIEAPARINLGAGASNPVSLSNLVDAIVSTIQSTYDGHTHVAPNGGGPTTTPSATIGAQGSTAASKTFAE